MKRSINAWNSGIANVLARVMAGVLVGAVGGAMSGCVGDAQWPPLKSEEARLNQINTLAGRSVLGEALSFAVIRQPPVVNAQRGDIYDGPVAVSLPEGVSLATYAVIVRRVGPNCEPATLSNRDRPTYHVARVIIRGTTAEVDVLFPSPRFGTDAQGNARYQGMTIFLAGGSRPWRVVSSRTFPVGLFDVPDRVELDSWGGGPSDEGL